MGYRKLSLTEVRRLFLISLGIGVIAGIYYLLSPYQQCKREAHIQYPEIQEEAVIDECLSRSTK
tara:strand:- start:780 stop:971 length:192 start_codon:yes stop_codon:yes gene_type:complete